MTTGCFVSDAEVGTTNLGQQNRHKITATLGLVVHAAGNNTAHNDDTLWSRSPICYQDIPLNK